MKAWIAFWNILRKDIKNYYLKPPNISWGIIFPLSWTLMQFIRLPNAETMEIRNLLPGLMGMSILFGTTSMLSVTITFERKGRSFDRLLLAPIGLNTLVLAKTSGAIIFGLLNAFWPVFFGSFFADLSSVHWPLVFIGALLTSVTSTFLGLTIAVSANEVFEAQTYSNFFRFPMIFLSGLFFPVSRLPVVVQPISYCLPLTYGADLMNEGINSAGMILPWINILLLIGFAALLFSISQMNIKRKWIQ